MVPPLLATSEPAASLLTRISRGMPPKKAHQFAHASVAVAKHAAGGRPHQEHPGASSQASDTKISSQFEGGTVGGEAVVGADAAYHNRLRLAAPSPYAAHGHVA